MTDRRDLLAGDEGMLRDAAEQARHQERQARWMAVIAFIVVLTASLLLQ